jgi:DNA topoisomerase IA
MGASLPEDKSKRYTKNYVDAIKKLSKDADRFIHACDYEYEGTLHRIQCIEICLWSGQSGNTVENEVLHTHQMRISWKPITIPYPWI